MSALLPLSNSNGAGDGHESAVVRCVQAYWPLGRVALLPVLVAIPMVIYRHDLHSLLDLWYVPLMGIVAAAIPAAGAPVAGGIVFFPILTLNHICPQEAVAFAAATQLVGVGVFTPLNWLATDPTVFDGFYDILNLALVPGIVGITVALIVQVRIFCRHPLCCISPASICAIMRDLGLQIGPASPHRRHSMSTRRSPKQFSAYSARSSSPTRSTVCALTACRRSSLTMA